MSKNNQYPTSEDWYKSAGKPRVSGEFNTPKQPATPSQDNRRNAEYTNFEKVPLKCRVE